MDMRNGFAVTGGPENALLAVAGADLARYYRMPSVSWMCTDSLYYDGQNALEKMLAASPMPRPGSAWYGELAPWSRRRLSPLSRR